MLDDEERTVLEETERALIRNDPQLARRMQRGLSGSRRGRRLAVTVVTLVLVVGLFWLGLPGHALLVMMLGLAFLVAFGWRPPERFTAMLRAEDDPTPR
jgi:predicted PurR-regulated permease PerM